MKLFDVNILPYAVHVLELITNEEMLRMIDERFHVFDLHQETKARLYWAHLHLRSNLDSSLIITEGRLLAKDTWKEHRTLALEFAQVVSTDIHRSVKSCMSVHQHSPWIDDLPRDMAT
ncbi:hypothetical protein WA026_001020 [Henosepilachna vigintioctopunctata]|uniref:PIN domain-containing protein n=1 Tax=Henosepilachna vigintioctopunctata TaxID=420089 RepID=A0AAW1V928_9CUCU